MDSVLRTLIVRAERNLRDARSDLMKGGDAEQQRLKRDRARIYREELQALKQAAGT